MRQNSNRRSGEMDAIVSERKLYSMNVDQISETDRTILLNAFRAYRANDSESDGTYPHRGALEAKLQRGEGVLDEVDVNLLQLSVAHMVPGEDSYRHLMGLLPDE